MTQPIFDRLQVVEKNLKIAHLGISKSRPNYLSNICNFELNPGVKGP